MLLMRTSKCDSCPLRSKKNKWHVPAWGPREAEIAVVGESPGNIEVWKRQPFVGPSGQLLRTVLKDVGCPPERVFMTNIVQCQVKDEKALRAIAPLCGSDLYQVLARRGVKTVIALGNVAMRFFTGMEKITANHGRASEWRGIAVVPTFHPAHILRGAEVLVEFSEDIAQAVQGPVLHRVPPIRDFSVITTVADAVRFLDSLGDFPVAVDIETSNLKVRDTRLLSAAFCWAGAKPVVLDGAVFYDSAVRGALQGCKARWVFHNGVFDAVRLGAQARFLPVISEDTMLLHYCLDERPGTQGLKYLATRYLYAEDWTADMKQHLARAREALSRLRKERGRNLREEEKMSLLPARVLWAYNANDAYWTYRLYEHYKPQVDADADLSRLYASLLLPLSNALARSALHGVYVDDARRRDLEAQCYARAAEIERMLKEMVGDERFNPRSVQHVRRYLYEVCGTPSVRDTRPVPADMVTKSVNLKNLKPNTTAQIQLQRLAHYPEYRAHEFAKLLIEYREVLKTATTYYRAFVPESDGRVHTNFRLTGTVTGRLSSSDPSVMNMSADGPVRSIVAAPEGCVLIAADYAQAEVRTGGTLARSEQMYRMFAEGRDIHAEVGRLVYGDRYDNKAHRRAAKSLTFGIFYRRGPQSIAETFGISLADARQVIERVLAWLQVSDWMAEQDRMALEEGYVKMPTGRRRRFPLITESNRDEVLRQAVNAPVQGAASDVTMYALIAISSWIRDFGGEVLFPTHDSILVECPRVHARDVALRMREDMLRAPLKVFGEGHIPFDVEFGVGYRYDKVSMVDWNPLEQSLEEVLR